jgi:cystathionine beta-lyase/cystathionine gamma-synthase
MSTEKNISLSAEGSMPDANSQTSWMNMLSRKRMPGPRTPHHSTLESSLGDSTKSVHSGTYSDPISGAVGTPIFQTTTFKFQEKTYDAFFQGVTRDIPIYTRYGNPSQWSVQEKISALENAESAVVFSSGMAAISTTIFALTNNGGHIITSYDLYGGTYNLVREDMHQAGREVSFVDPASIRDIEASIQDNTQMILLESLTNPLLKGLPMSQISELAKKHNILVVIDNTFLSPMGFKAIDHGADVVLHSATKYLNGHSDLTAGVASGSRKFMDRIWAQMLRFGGHLDANSCFLLERGLKTLALRMSAHSKNSSAIAHYLDQHPKIKKVYHPCLENYPYKEMAEICHNRSGGIVSFEVEGGNEAGKRFMEKLNIATMATSLGGVESLVSMPFNTSHSSLTERQQQQVGIMPGLVRFSAGIEDVQDLLNDIKQALD